MDAPGADSAASDSPIFVITLVAASIGTVSSVLALVIIFQLRTVTLQVGRRVSEAAKAASDVKVRLARISEEWGPSITSLPTLGDRFRGAKSYVIDKAGVLTSSDDDEASGTQGVMARMADYVKKKTGRSADTDAAPSVEEGRRPPSSAEEGRRPPSSVEEGRRPPSSVGSSLYGAVQEAGASLRR